MKHLLNLISKLFKWMGFGKIQKEFEMINKLLESQKKTENGQRTETTPDGKKYVGESKDGKRSGKGTFTYPDGQKFVGEYKDGKIHGQGIFTFPSGEKNVGEWKDSKMWNV